MKKSSKQSLIVFSISMLSIAVIALGVVNFQYMQKNKTLERYLEASYYHAFDELCSGVEQIDTALKKSLVAASPSTTSLISTEIFGRAMTAQMSLGALPCGTSELEQTAAFISQVGDYALSLSRLSAQGQYDDETRANLRSLSNSAEILSQNLSRLQLDIHDGRLTMDELEKAEHLLEASEGGDATVGASMRMIEGEFPEIPALIYDGPFSQHISDMKPRQLEGTEEIDQNQARKAASSFASIHVGKVSPAGQCNGKIPCYYFNASVGDDDLTIAISQQGGKPISMTSAIQPIETAIEMESAEEIAARFLEQRGFHDMVQSYYMLRDNIATINFAYSQDGVICYPDLIKLDISMDTGAVIGFEAMGYMSSHQWREFPAIEVDADTARGKIHEDFEILSHQLALIPTSGKHEILCHEFKCTDAENQQNYIIYVNVQTGEQEKILILLEDETGALTL